MNLWRTYYASAPISGAANISEYGCYLLLKADDPQIRVVCQTGTVQMTKAMLSVKAGCCEGQNQSSHEGWLSAEVQGRIWTRPRLLWTKVRTLDFMLW